MKREMPASPRCSSLPSLGSKLMNEGTILDIPALADMTWWRAILDTVIHIQTKYLCSIYTKNSYNSVVIKQKNKFSLEQGSPTPMPWTSTCPWPVWNQAAQKGVNGGWNWNYPSTPTQEILSQNGSLVPKRLGTIFLQHSQRTHKISWYQSSKPCHFWPPEF